MMFQNQERAEISLFKIVRHCIPKPFLAIIIFLIIATVILLLEHRNPKSNRQIVHFLVGSVQSSYPTQPKVLECDHKNYIYGKPINQEDPCLVAAFKEALLIPPPPFEEQNHNNSLLNIPGDIPTNIEKLKWVEKILIQNPNQSQRVNQGFFIECGANDGDFISPTIRLEKLYNWTGLLIEANPTPFQTLIKKKRNAYAVNAAVCVSPHPELVTFYSHRSNTGIAGLNKRAEMGVSINKTVQCIPLYTMLAALKIYTVDYLSLDVEGLELAILKTVPFDKITFKVMTIEHWSIPGGYQALKQFLEPKGYRYVKILRDQLTQDSLFVHKSLYTYTMSIRM